MTASDDLYAATKSLNWKFIDNFVKNGGDINTSLISTGPQAGYTALHLVTTKNANEEHVLRLIKFYGANVNSVGKDRTQPIHLACLLGNYRVVKILLEAGANPDAELTRELYEQYAKDKKEFHKIGDVMTLLSFAVINDELELSICLLKYQVTVGMRSIVNKVVLIFAVENGYFIIAQLIVSIMKNYTGLIDACVRKDWYAVYYLLPSIKEFKTLLGMDLSLTDGQDVTRNQYTRSDADINATINRDPDTLLTHLAAWKCSEHILEVLLNLDGPSGPKFKTAHNTTLLLPCNSEEEDNKPPYARIEGFMLGIFFWITSMGSENKYQFIKLAAEDMSFRREFGLFIPEDEKDLIDKLCVKHVDIEKIVRDYDNFINKTLTTKIIYFGNQSTSMYDLVVRVFDEKKLKQLLKDENFVKARGNLFTKNDFENPQLGPIIKLIDYKVNNLCRRQNLMNKVEKIGNLREAVPLPYEIVLIIIEFVSNNDLARFVDAFYEYPISFK